MKPLTFGSLFAGIGGFDLGLERAGMVCKWQVEIDDYATKVLEKHWPNVKRYKDVREVGENLERVDAVAGGFPCQDVSIVGQRAGIEEGTRSGLWLEFKRIIRVIKPRFVLVENVAGLLSANAGRDMGRVLADLAELGFDAEWKVLYASDFNAPQERERLFIVAHTMRERWNALGKVLQTSAAERLRQWGSETTRETNVHSSNGPRRRIRRIPDAPVFRMDDESPAWVDRLKCLGNSIYPDCAEWIGHRIVEAHNAV